MMMSITLQRSEVELLPRERCEEFCDEKGGICNSVKMICKCRYNYASYYNDYSLLGREGDVKRKKFCNYERTSRIKAAFIELVFGFGTGHLYSQRKLNGMLKMIISTFSFCCCCCLLLFSAKIDAENLDDNQSFVKISFILFMMCYCILIAWQIVDFFFFIIGIYLDGNDIELY